MRGSPGNCASLNLGLTGIFLFKVHTDPSEIASSTVSGAVAGGITGALTGFGAFTLATMIGTAGTGAAISGLSGVAATNAALAWLGGGTLAAGGFGMLGGTALLTGLVALPALLITGATVGAKSEKIYAQTMTKVEEAKQKKAEANLVVEKFRQITQVADLSRKILKEISILSHDILPKLNAISFEYIKRGNEEAQILIFKATQFCNLLNQYATNINKRGDSESEQNNVINEREKELKFIDSVIGEIKTLEV